MGDGWGMRDHGSGDEWVCGGEEVVLGRSTADENPTTIVSLRITKSRWCILLVTTQVR